MIPDGSENTLITEAREINALKLHDQKVQRIAYLLAQKERIEGQYKRDMNRIERDIDETIKQTGYVEEGCCRMDSKPKIGGFTF